MWCEGAHVCVPLWTAHAAVIAATAAVLSACVEDAPRTCLALLTLASIALTIALENAPRTTRAHVDVDTRPPSRALSDVTGGELRRLHQYAEHQHRQTQPSEWTAEQARGGPSPHSRPPSTFVQGTDTTLYASGGGYARAAASPTPSAH